MAIWNALRIATQVAGELGLDVPASLVSTSDKIASQLLSLMNAAGAELLMYFPWEQLAKEYAPAIIANQDAYALPADFAYFRDQTQWDRTNRWPLMGPKSAQEWAFLKGSLVAALPRQRFRLQGGSFVLFPAPTSALNIRAEYISEWWVGLGAGSAPVKDTITLDTDLIYYNPWLIVKFVKFKFYELKGFPTAGVNADFMRAFDSQTSNDLGAEKLNMAGNVTNFYLGPGSVPDGSWVV